MTRWKIQPNPRKLTRKRVDALFEVFDLGLEALCYDATDNHGVDITGDDETIRKEIAENDVDTYFNQDKVWDLVYQYRKAVTAAKILKERYQA